MRKLLQISETSNALISQFDRSFWTEKMQKLVLLPATWFESLLKYNKTFSNNKRIIASQSSGFRHCQIIIIIIIIIVLTNTIR